MNELDKNQKKIFLIVRILAFAIFVLLPIVFWVVANTVDAANADFESIDLLQNILLVFSLVFPAITFFVKNRIVSLIRKRLPNESRTEQFYLPVFLVYASLVEEVYIFGFIIYFLSGDLQRMMYFYPIGIIWTFIFWPTRGKFEQFISEFKTT